MVFPSGKCQPTGEDLRGSQGVFEMEEVSLARVCDSLPPFHLAGWKLAVFCQLGSAPAPAAPQCWFLLSLVCSGHVQRAFPPRSHRVLQVWKWDPNKEQKRFRSAKWGEIHEPERVHVARFRPAKCSLTEPYLWMQLNSYSQSHPNLQLPRTSHWTRIGHPSSAIRSPGCPRITPRHAECADHKALGKPANNCGEISEKKCPALSLSHLFFLSFSLSPMLCGKRNKNISQHSLLIRICFPTQKKTTFALQRKF